MHVKGAACVRAVHSPGDGTDGTQQAIDAIGSAGTAAEHAMQPGLLGTPARQLLGRAAQLHLFPRNNLGFSTHP